jgi:hypothetical protein
MTLHFGLCTHKYELSNFLSDVIRVYHQLMEMYMQDILCYGKCCWLNLFPIPIRSIVQNEFSFAVISDTSVYIAVAVYFTSN